MSRGGRAPGVGSWILAVALASSAGAAEGPCRIGASIAVEGLPEGPGFVTVSLRLDLQALAREAGVEGLVDERSIDLVCLDPGGGGPHDTEEQFSPEPNSRGRRPGRLPGTPPTVCWAEEIAAGERPLEGAGTRGWLHWIVRTRPGTTTARFSLRLDVPRSGRAVRVPFPPWNWRHFDADGRIRVAPLFPRMRIRPPWPLDGRLCVSEGPDLVTTYHAGPSIADAIAGRGGPRHPFFYPVHGPEGAPVTDFGKSHDPTGSHRHHTSLWVAHASVDGRDFWSDRGGAIAHERLELLEDGPLFCRLVQRTRWLPRAGSEVERPDVDALLVGERTWTVWREIEGTRLVDLDLRLAASGERPVTLGETTFGPLAVRVATSMCVFDGGGEITNALGARNERQTHRQRAAWIDQSGPVAPDRWAGIAILDHPSNPRHPTGWHSRNDGWAGAAFNMTGPWTIEPDRPLRLRYRIVIHPGSAREGTVAQRFRELAAEVTVRRDRAVELGAQPGPEPGAPRPRSPGAPPRAGRESDGGPPRGSGRR